MISLDSADALKEAGLAWQPGKGDQFAIPDRGLDAQVFVVNDMAVFVENLKGTPAMTFHGTPEWALDYIYLGDVVWLPSEAQLRNALQEALAGQADPVFDLLYMDGAYTCRFEWQGQAMAFKAADAAEAYALALLHVFRTRAEGGEAQAG